MTPPMSSDRTTATRHEMLWRTIITAAAAPTNAAMDPTDRSMWRPMMTITMPIARMRSS